MSEGQLRMRVRAYEREKAWAPRYVANELAGTRQAAADRRRTAMLRGAEADTATGEERARLEREAREASALAELLDERVAQLAVEDDVRTKWLLHTAGTRAEADRASAALTAQHAGDQVPEPEVTAEEWLALHDEAMRAEDAHREITDLTDEHASAVPGVDSVEDIRDIAALEPAPLDEDLVRVPSGEEMAESVRRAQRALAEIRARDATDAEREVDESRVGQLARWREDDQADGLEDGAELEDAPW